MTLAECATFCASYTYYGVEYGTECYCGNAIAASAVVASNCTVPCGGDDTQLCGGGWAMNLFTNEA